MKQLAALTVVSLAACCIPHTLNAQEPTATPYLSITTSIQGNGMGGVAATVPSSDPAATIANPAQLGLFSLDNLFSASTYSEKTELYPNRPSFLPTITMTVSALNAGLNLKDLVSLPFPVSLGFGYSRTFVDLGTFSLTNPSGPAVVGTFRMNDTYENISVGLGFEYFARLGIGMNFKKITSVLPAIGTQSELSDATAKPSATDFGILLEIPIVQIFSEVSGTSFMFANGMEPFLNTSMSYVKSNVGDEVRYVDPSEGDPLPRMAVIGLGFEGGLSAKAGKRNWRMISCALTHQAEDVLVTWNNNGTFVYEGGLGELRIGENVLVGRVTGGVLVRKGWQVGLAELFYIRGGSVQGVVYDYSTSGYSVCLGGLIRLLEFVSPEIAGTSWIAFIGDHVDLQFHTASYDSPLSTWDGITFKGFNLVIHGMPW